MHQIRFRLRLCTTSQEGGSSQRCPKPFIAGFQKVLFLRERTEGGKRKGKEKGDVKRGENGRGGTKRGGKERGKETRPPIDIFGYATVLVFFVMQCMGFCRSGRG